MKYLLENQESDRLIFRLIEQGDFDMWLEFFKKDGVAGFIGLGNISTPEEQCKKWFEKIEYRYANNLGGMNALINKSTNEFIGQAGLLKQVVDGIEELEVAYSIMPQHWFNGYATEAAMKCRNSAFENSWADSLISIVHVENTKSQKVAIKNGMVSEKQTMYRDMPVHIFRIHQKTWKNLK